MRFESFEENYALKEFSSWGPDAAKAAMDREIRGTLQYLIGYEAVSTEETQIDGQAALVHRFTATNKRGTGNSADYYTGINTTYITISATFDDVDDKTVEAEMRSDMDAFLKSIDLSGLD